jgi:5,10-methylenetetrahydrofolate reductase
MVVQQRRQRKRAEAKQTVHVSFMLSPRDDERMRRAVELDATWTSEWLRRAVAVAIDDSEQRAREEGRLLL